MEYEEKIKQIEERAAANLATTENQFQQKIMAEVRPFCSFCEITNFESGGKVSAACGGERVAQRTMGRTKLSSGIVFSSFGQRSFV